MSSVGGEGSQATLCYTMCWGGGGYHGVQNVVFYNIYIYSVDDIPHEYIINMFGDNLLTQQNYMQRPRKRTPH